MDKKFLRYLRDKKDISKIAIALALGLILIFIGGRSKEETVSKVGLEERIADACSGVAGVGECDVFVYSSSGTEDGVVESVIVVCEGGDSLEVRYKLTDMLSSFLGIGTNRIKIEKKYG